VLAENEAPTVQPVAISLTEVIMGWVDGYEDPATFIPREREREQPVPTGWEFYCVPMRL